MDRFQPIKNPLDKEAEDEGYAFELYGLQFGEVIKVANDSTNRIWTRIESDEFVTITNGLHFVNREKYYITEIPCPIDEIIEVPLFDASDFEGSEEDDKNDDLGPCTNPHCPGHDDD